MEVEFVGAVASATTHFSNKRMMNHMGKQDPKSSIDFFPKLHDKIIQILKKLHDTRDIQITI
jgi:hypothetical protein